MNKQIARSRRASRGRAKIKLLGVNRLCVHRTPKNIYAQIIADGKVLACASTLEKDIRSGLKYGGNIAAAKVVGEKLAQRAVDVGIKEVAFDRSGFRYHGRIKALADSAREAGLSF